MSNLGTRIQDVIIPEVYAPYMRQDIIERSAIINSGVTSGNATLNEKVSSGGSDITMPMWERLEGDSEIQSDGTREATPGGITSIKDRAVVHYREKLWTSANLASALAGDSAQDAISAMEAEWWVREEQKFLLATLTGMFNSPTMGTSHVLNAGTDVLDADITLDAQQLLGDNSDMLAIMLTHSRTLTNLKKQNLIDYIPTSRGEIEFATYLGYRIVPDDTMQPDETFLLASGVVGRGDGIPVDMVPVEVFRKETWNIDCLLSRRAFVMHPMGVRWIGSAADASPTLAELRDGDNWEKVYPDKHLGFVKIKHGIAMSRGGIVGASSPISPLNGDDANLENMSDDELRTFAADKGIAIPANVTRRDTILNYIRGAS